jgi:hypothetical protein
MPAKEVDLGNIAGINSLYFGVMRLRTYENSANVRKKATGFYYTNDDDKDFLITNKHVVVDEMTFYHPTTIKTLLHSDKNDLKKNTEIEIQLYDDNGKRNWLEHKTVACDIAANPMDEVLANYPDTFAGTFSKVHLMLDQSQVLLGHDVIVLGYPLGEWYDAKNNLPTVRSGTLASAYPIYYDDNPYFLVEATLHEGTSGAPVLSKPGSSILLGGEMRPIYFPYLLGINSSTFDFPEGEQPSNYNAAYYASLIDDIVNNGA